jgi:hypothetical protein
VYSCLPGPLFPFSYLFPVSFLCPLTSVPLHVPVRIRLAYPRLLMLGLGDKAEGQILWTCNRHHAS